LPRAEEPSLLAVIPSAPRRTRNLLFPACAPTSAEEIPGFSFKDSAGGYAFYFSSQIATEPSTAIKMAIQVAPNCANYRCKGAHNILMTTYLGINHSGIICAALIGGPTCPCTPKARSHPNLNILLDSYPIMDNTSYEIRCEFLDGRDLLLSLSEEDRRKIDLAIGSLAKNPLAKLFGLKQIDERSYKITVPIGNDEIIVMYEVDPIEGIIDLVQIKRQGPIKKALKWLSGLTDFEPGVRP
jgi:hypothetical protein